MGAKLGSEAKLYRQTTGTRAAWPASGAAPSLDEVKNIRDLTLNISSGEADVTTRQNNGWKATLETLKEGSLDFEMVWDTADADFTAIRAAYFAKTSLAMAVLDGDSATAATEGLWANFRITEFTREEPLDGPITVKVSMKPTYAAVPPEWVVVVAA